MAHLSLEVQLLTRVDKERDNQLVLPGRHEGDVSDRIAIALCPVDFVLFSGWGLYTGMLSFFEFIAQSRKMTLPDTHTMLAMAGVSLDVPNKEETERLLNREKKRPIASMSGGTRKLAAPAGHQRGRPRTGTPGV